MSENTGSEWVNWRLAFSSPDDEDETLFIGKVPLHSIHVNHQHFDLKNAKGTILLGCKVYGSPEWRRSDDVPSYDAPSNGGFSYVPMALTPDGWCIKLDENTMLRRSEGSELAEAQTRVAEERTKRERELALRETMRRMADENLAKLGKKPGC